MKTTKLKIIFSLFALAIFCASCDEESEILKTYNGEVVYSFSRTAVTIGVCEPSATIVIGASSASSAARTVNFTVNAASTADESEYSFTSMSVTIPAGEFVGTTTVNIDFEAIPDGASRDLVLDLVVPSDGGTYERSSATISYASACTLNEVTLALGFDSYPGETAWQIFTAGGAFVTGDSAFGNYAGLANFSTTLCLESGDYLLRLLDSFGDGFCCNYGAGSANLTLDACDGSSPLIDEVSEAFTGGELIVPFTIN